MVRQRKARTTRRAYSEEFKEEAVQMLLDGHRPKAVAANLGLSGTNLLYRWKAKLLEHSGRPPLRSKDACDNWKSSSAASSANAMS
jgi:transposase-like protein